MRSHNQSLRLCALWFICAGALIAAPDVRQVDCSRQSLQKAIEKAEPGDTLRLTGICHEHVVIVVDRITIDGLGSARIDGGGSSGGTFEAVVLIQGARGVIIRGMTVRGGSSGILARPNATFKVQNTIVEANQVGIALLDGSSGEIADCTITNNTEAGVAIVNNSTAAFKGSVRVNGNGEGVTGSGSCALEIQGGVLEANGNQKEGLSLSGCDLNIYGIPESNGSAITANGNGTDGILIGGGQFVLFGSQIGDKTITALNNGANGINLPGFASIVNLGTGKFVLQGNAVGLNLGSESSIVSIGGLNIQNNATGILGDGAGSLTLVSIPPNPSTILGNTTTDINLRFGARMTIGGATVGTVKCDSTVLSRGSTKCP